MIISHCHSHVTLDRPTSVVGLFRRQPLLPHLSSPVSSLSHQARHKTHRCHATLEDPEIKVLVDKMDVNVRAAPMQPLPLHLPFISNTNSSHNFSYFFLSMALVIRGQHLHQTASEGSSTRPSQSSTLSTPTTQERFPSLQEGSPSPIASSTHHGSPSG